MGQRKRCHNCKFASSGFKVLGITHHHCQHPKHDKDREESLAWVAWVTLRRFDYTCKLHELKEKSKVPS